MLEEVAVLTGGRVISEDAGFKLENITIADLGRAKRVTINKDDTTIVEGLGKAADIKSRIGQIRHQIEDTTSEYDKEKLQERLAKMAGGVAVINVGAATEVEMKEKKARVEDALAATRAAVEEGVVPGGGITLLRATKALGKLDLDGDESIGRDMVRRALEEPVRQIALNAGAEGSLVVERILKGALEIGYDAATGEYVDLVAAGIVDPTKVARSALQNAGSVASLLLTTEAVITDMPEEEKAAMPPGGGGGGMGGMGGMY